MAVNVAKYYSAVRADAIELIPAHAKRVIEIGCGEGKTLQAIKRRGLSSWVAGVELVEEVAARIPEEVDQVWTGKFEEISLGIEAASIDAILCLDVLEHMQDPWGAVHRIHQLLKTGGVLIASVPNIRYKGVLIPLITRGEWTYADAGILDRTHLRFFTKKSAKELVECSGLSVDRIEAVNKEKFRPFRKRWILSKISAGLLDDFYVDQYLIRAVSKP